jgi:hypothetical protein
VGAHLAQQVVEVSSLTYDLDALIREQPSDPRPKQKRVFTEDYTHGPTVSRLKVTVRKQCG